MLSSGARGAWARRQLREGTVAAPHLIDLEVTSALRRLRMRGELSTERADLAVADLRSVAVTRYGSTQLLDSIWGLSANLTAYDAAYVALAAAFGCELATTDLRLARAPGLPVQVRTP
jgi:predicted nucleic acid-binding protein